MLLRSAFARPALTHCARRSLPLVTRHWLPECNHIVRDSSSSRATSTCSSSTSACTRATSSTSGGSSGSSNSSSSKQQRRRWAVWGGIAVGASALSVASVCAYREPEPDPQSLPRVYDAQVFEAFWSQYPWARRCRWLAVGKEVVPMLMHLLWELRRSSRLPETERSHAHWQLASDVREMLTRLGPAFIKAGQALSIRPDIIPAVALKELQRLCDDCPAFAWPLAEAILKEELGCEVKEMFILPDDNPKPIAAASLGQVYRWKLQSNGQEVAVKVQRPGMAAAVTLDICILRALATALRWYIRNFTANRLDHVQLVDAWAAGTVSELDYVAEASNQRHFREQLYKSMGDRVYIPKVIDSLCTRHVLVTEWVHGARLADCDKEIIKALVPVGVDCFLTQMLELGVFHADPHPGNLLVRGNQLVLLDFGLVAKIDRKNMQRLATSTVHLVQGNFEALMADLIALDFLPEDVNLEKVMPPLQHVLEQGIRSAGSDMKTRAKNLQGMSDELNAVFYEMPFNVPDYFALTTRALVVLEGIALAGDPDFDLFRAAYPFACRKTRQFLGESGAASWQVVAKAAKWAWQSRQQQSAAGPLMTPVV